MQAKIKFTFAQILLFIALLAVAVSSLTAVVASVISEVELVTLKAKSFSAKDSSGTYTYDAYIIDEGEKTIAIGWGQEPDDTPDESTLVIPDSLTHPKTGVSYDVTAIATAGFRYCDFASVTVPEAVTEIGEEAFAYCDNMTAFAIPNGVTEIKAGTFMDCRALTNLSYLDEDGNSTMYNSTITSIGDHAFDSCVSMVVFNCPSSVVSFGKSCFQKCSSMVSFTFPQSNAGGTNLISVGAFAFADCSSLSYIYFETNMSSIGDYAFADCANSLFIEYTGNSVPSFSANWRRRYIATNRNNSSDANGLTGNLIRINTSTPVTRRDLRFPGLKYSVVSIPSGSSLLLDWGGDDTPVELIEGPRRFAQITGFSAPTAAELATLTDNGSYYYTVAGNVKTLIIPDVVKDPDSNATNATLDVLTINGVGFQNKTNSELTAIKFNKSLVQISHEVFQNCTGLTTVDFSECQNLVEIGCRAFENCNKITSLSIPYSVEYIGDFAFSRCDLVRSLSFSELNTLFKKQTVVEDEQSVDKWLPVPGVVTKGLVPPTASASNGTHYIDTYHNKAYIRQNDAWVDLEVDFGTSDPTGGNVGDYYLCIPRLQVIGEGAFHRIGWSMSTSENATVNLVLPESLNDKAAEDANLDHVGDSYYPGSGYPTGTVANPTGGRVSFREVAVGRHAFDRAKCLATVEMAEAIGAHKTNKDKLTYTCSIGTSCFARCNNLLRFQASENFYTIGASCFNAKTENSWSTFKLKEIFLTSDKACNENCDFNYPFGIGNSSLANSNGDPIAVGGVQKDLVIYVSGDIPGDLENYSNYKDITKTDQTPNDKPRWNVEKNDVVSFPNTFGEKSYRSQIPTYWNVDWQANDGLLYWKIDGSLASKPKSKADYTDNRIVFVKTSGSSDYICSKFYCNTANIGLSTLIDLTNIPNDDMDIPDTYPAEEIEENDISSNLISIGSCAFAAFSDVNRGVYFVLPDTVERIEERAFYNNLGKAAGGVKVVTYRDSDNDKIMDSTGSSYADDETFESDLSTSAFCTLSDNISYIGRDAFYGNAFNSVLIGNGIAANGFNTTPFSSIDGEQSNITSFSIGTNGCGLSVDNSTGGLYYSGDGKKFLLFQPVSASSGSSLVIASGTTAIGRLALARTNYTSVEIPSSVTTLYGGCFQNSAVTTIVGGTGIKYINAAASGGDAEQWDSSLPFDQLDGPNAAKSNDTSVKTNSLYYNSFKGCTSLATINFKGMSALKIIGTSAFQGCTGLSNMTNGATYSYSYANNGSNQMNRSIILADPINNLNAGVLDLTSCNSLTNIKSNAFNGCTSLRFVHSPQTVASHDSTTTLTVDSGAFPTSANLSILVGDAYSSAKNKVSGFGNSDRLYYKVNDAVMVKNADLSLPGDNDYGREGGYYIFASGANSKAYQKVAGAWVQIDIPTSRIKTSDPTGGSAGDYWIKYSNTNYTLFKKISSSKWSRVGDVNDSAQDEEDNGNGTYSSAKRNYWVYDENTNRYILFNKSGGLYPAKLVKDYFYYGLAS